MKWVIAVIIITMVVLHQDWWFWTDKTLVLGFLPVGLAYHLAYAILAAIVMVFLVKNAWPHHLEATESASAEVAE